MSIPPSLFLIYDARAAQGCPDDATVLDTARTFKEARKAAKAFGETAIYKYRIAGKNLVDECHVATTDEDGDLQ